MFHQRFSLAVLLISATTALCAAGEEIPASSSASSPSESVRPAVQQPQAAAEAFLDDQEMVDIQRKSMLLDFKNTGIPWQDIMIKGYLDTCYSIMEDRHLSIIHVI